MLPEIRLKHKQWRALWPGAQTHFHRHKPLKRASAVLFHMDLVTHPSDDPIFPDEQRAHRQFQWFDNLDELAAYAVHVVDWAHLGRPLEGVPSHRASSAWASLRSAIAATEGAKIRDVQRAISGPKAVLLEALQARGLDLGGRADFGDDAVRVFRTVGDAMSWILADLPGETPFGRLNEPRSEDRTADAEWLADALAVDDPKALKRTAARLRACSDPPGREPDWISNFPPTDYDAERDIGAVWVTCRQCQQRARRSEARANEDGEFICDDCYFDRYAECPECLEVSLEVGESDCCPHCGHRGEADDEEEEEEGDLDEPAG